MAKVHVKGLAATTARLRGLPRELVGKNGGPIRKALFQAAKVIEEDARSKAQAVDDPTTETNIAKNVKKWREPRPDTFEGRPAELFHVGVDGRKAPHWHFLELGTAKQPAQPYLRPAFEAQKQAAVDRFAEVLDKDIKRLEKKVAKQARVV